MKSFSRLSTPLYAAAIAAVGVSFSLGGTLALMSTPAKLEVPAVAMASGRLQTS